MESMKSCAKMYKSDKKNNYTDELINKILTRANI